MNTYEAQNMKDWIILDNGSTVNVFSNKYLVNDIRETNEIMELATNVGVRWNNKKANVPDYGEVWYDENAITNIFSMKEMIKKHRVTYDSEK